MRGKRATFNGMRGKKNEYEMNLMVKKKFLKEFLLTVYCRITYDAGIDTSILQ